ncbi:hypothetical protein [Fibrella aestuarina]|uniref:hypothetical protein n=1 Tax=Fibrella aestuarina TaxID=651143 RepID=UPI0011D25101|nr:hypothetical protein [Fibrella aestuarina]
MESTPLKIQMQPRGGPFQCTIWYYLLTFFGRIDSYRGVRYCLKRPLVRYRLAQNGQPPGRWHNLYLPS